MASRPSFRIFQAARSAFRQPLKQRRWQSSAAGPSAGASESGFTKFLNSPIGPRTVHFWAPIMKWGVVIAGASDFLRPAESLSLSQNLALTATGAIWTRWCLIIKPKNYFLAAVNFFLFLVGSTQTARILTYQQSIKNQTLPAEIKDAAREEKESLKAIGEEIKGAVKR